MDEALRQYREDILKAKLSRRGFLAAAGFAGMAAALAACSPSSSSAAPSSAAAAPSAAAPSVAAPSAAAATAAPSYGPVESDFFLFNWSGYFSPDNQKAFDAAFNTTIKYDTFASNEDLLAKLQAGGKGQYDVCVPTAEFVPTLVKQGLLQKLDKARLPNLATISPQFLGMPFDLNNEYIVPKDWGTTGIIYRGNKMKDPIASWKDFWRLATTTYSGKTFVVDSPGDVFVAPLRMHGFDVNTTNKDELEIARKELMTLRPHLQSIDSDTYDQSLRDEVAVLGLAWNGTAYVLQSDASGKYKDTGYVVPSDGTIFWTDTWVMLAEAPHPNAAYTFLNWIQDPKQQVVESLYAGYASCNDAAKPLLPADFTGNPAVYVPADQLSLLSVATDQTGNQQRADIWAQFKAG
jgi:spermidine/putrescine transport system substrate-binding protein